MAETLVKGPNKISPAESYVSIDRNDAVKLRIGEDEISGRDAISVPGLLNRTARDYPDHKALIFKNSTGEWETTTYSYVYLWHFKFTINILQKIYLLGNIKLKFIIWQKFL